MERIAWLTKDEIIEAISKIDNNTTFNKILRFMETNHKNEVEIWIDD